MNKIRLIKISISPIYFVFSFILLPVTIWSQINLKDSILQEVTLKNSVEYAILHQPQINQSIIDQALVETTIKSKLADWYPQINFNYNLQHNFIRQTTFIGGNAIQLGTNNSSFGQFTLSQNIFNRDVALASQTKDDVRLQAKQKASNTKIEIAAAVSKSYYDVLSTMEQIKIATANITRIQQSLKDALNQYKAGITDKIDYKRATIALNNAKATQYSNQQSLIAKQDYLKTLMGYPSAASLNIVYDSLQMEKEIMLDTLQTTDYTARIEYKLLSTRQRLLTYNLKYNKWSYLPTVAFNGAYNLNYFNNNFNKIYNKNLPNSFAALTLAIPIFQGGKRKANIEAAELELQRSSLDIVSFKNNLNSDYTKALANYKSYLQNYTALKENAALAQEVYDVIQLQYRSGIKTYLEVITAESDLRNAQIAYYTALYAVLSKALGQIIY